MTILRSLLLLMFAVGARLAVAANNPTTFHDWGIGTSDDKTFVFAATINDSGEAFGEYCYFKTGNCLWILGLHTKCDPNEPGIVLSNTATGSVSLNITCRGSTGKDMYTYVFSDWKSLEANIKDVSRIGFAFALASEQFSVVRFSLNGRTDSTAAIESYFSSQIKDKKQTTLDEKL